MNIVFAKFEAGPTLGQIRVRDTLMMDLHERGFDVSEAELPESALTAPHVQQGALLAADVTHPGTQAERTLLRAARELGKEVLLYSTEVPGDMPRPKGMSGASRRSTYNKEPGPPNRARRLRQEYADLGNISVHSASTPEVALQLSRMMALVLTDFADVHADMATRSIIPLPPEGTVPEATLFLQG